MSQAHIYSDGVNQPIVSIVQGIDKDVEHGEDMVMLGYGMILAAPLFAPILPPVILLPLMAVVFLISVCCARRHFHKIAEKLKASIASYQDYDFSALNPLLQIFAEHPKHSLADGFNPGKNLARTAKSFLGALMINTFWMPIFYLLGMQFVEEKQLFLLNQAVMKVEERIKH